MYELSKALAQAQQWDKTRGTIATIPDSYWQAQALRELGIALAQTQQLTEASQSWKQAERVIATIQSEFQREEALCDFGKALAQAQQWDQAERVIATIPDSYWQAQALPALSTALGSAGEIASLLRVIQRAWRRVETREEALTLFSIASSIISRNPEVGIPLFDAFTSVDTFLGGSA